MRIFLPVALAISAFAADPPAPQPKMVMTALPDALKAPQLDIQRKLYSAQEQLQKAVLSCQACLQAQFLVNSLAQQAKDNADAAAKEFGCVGSLNPETLMCQKPEAPPAPVTPAPAAKPEVKPAPPAAPKKK